MNVIVRATFSLLFFAYGVILALVFEANDELWPAHPWLAVLSLIVLLFSIIGLAFVLIPDNISRKLRVLAILGAVGAGLFVEHEFRIKAFVLLLVLIIFLVLWIGSWLDGETLRRFAKKRNKQN